MVRGENDERREGRRLKPPLGRLTVAKATGESMSLQQQGGRHGVITQDLAERLAPAAGLRNRLVQEYDAIDDSIVLDAVRLANHDFGVFVTAIEEYLQQV